MKLLYLMLRPLHAPACAMQELPVLKMPNHCCALLLDCGNDQANEKFI